MTYTIIPKRLLPQEISSVSMFTASGEDSGVPYTKLIGMVFPEYKIVPELPPGIVNPRS